MALSEHCGKLLLGKEGPANLSDVPHFLLLSSFAKAITQTLREIMELDGGALMTMLTSTDERKQLIALVTLRKEASQGLSTVALLLPLVIQRFLTPLHPDKK